MPKEQNQDNKHISKEYKILAKNSILSIIHIYSSFFFSLITSFIIARLISADIWSYLIISTSYITIFSLILTFLPPSLGLTFNYYIPKYRALKQFNMLRSFVKNSLILRSLFVLLAFTISLVVFIVLSDLFKINLENYYHILLILSPLIIIDGLGKILIAIERSLNFFNIAIYLLIIRYVLNIGGLIFITLFFETIQLSYIVYINLFSSLIPFLINCIIFILIFKNKIKRSDENGISFNATFKYLYNYGSHLSVKSFIDGLIKESRVQLIRLFETTDFVTGYHIAYNYKSLSGQIFQSMPNPLTISFSELHTKKKFKEINRLYEPLFHYLVFTILLITALLIYFSDFFLFLIYGEAYLKFALLLKLVLNSLIFNVVSVFFYTLLRAYNKVKLVVPISILMHIIAFPLFLIGLIFFGISEAIIASTIGAFINFSILVFLNFKIFKLRIKLIKIFFQYFIYFFGLGFTWLLEILILNDINSMMLEALHLSFFKSIPFLSICVFLIIYLALNIILKIINRRDLEYVEAFFDRDTFVNKILRKSLRLIKRIMS